jgi:energy-coupling factor transporter ATP-binding protein EcfA2
MMRFLGIGAAVTLGGVCTAILSWPLIDAKLLPHLHYLALRRSAVWDEDLPARSLVRWRDLPPRPVDVPARHLTPEQTTACAALRRLLDPNAAECELVVLTGPTGCGKSTVLRALTTFAGRDSTTDVLSPDQPIVYVSCRNFTESSTFLYGTLTHLFSSRLGLLGDFVMAYHKLYNAVVDIVTMNQQHNHVSFILFCQAWGHLRGALRRWKKEHAAVGGRPILVIDHAEQLVENEEAHAAGSDISLFAHLLVNLLVRCCHDEQLAHVVFAFEADCLAPGTVLHGSAVDAPVDATESSAARRSCLLLSGTRLGTAFPSLVRHASMRSLPPRTVISTTACASLEAMEAYRTVVRAAGAQPLLCNALCELLDPSEASRAPPDAARVRHIQPGTAADRLEVDLEDVADALAALARGGFLTPVVGACLVHDATSGAARADAFGLRRVDRVVGFERTELLDAFTASQRRALSHVSVRNMGRDVRSRGPAASVDVHCAGMDGLTSINQRVASQLLQRQSGSPATHTWGAITGRWKLLMPRWLFSPCVVSLSGSNGIAAVVHPLGLRNGAPVAVSF